MESLKTTTSKATSTISKIKTLIVTTINLVNFLEKRDWGVAEDLVSPLQSLITDLNRALDKAIDSTQRTLVRYQEVAINEANEESGKYKRAAQADLQKINKVINKLDDLRY